MKTAILYAPTGAGHLSVATALAEGLDALGAGTPDLLDLFDSPNLRIWPRIGRFYDGPLIRHPVAFEAIWYASYPRTARRMFAAVDGWLNSLPVDQVLEQFLDHDLLVSTHPIVSLFLHRTRLPFTRLCDVITDPVSVHPLWYQAPRQHVIAPSEEAYVDATRRLPSEALLHRSPYPIRTQFRLDKTEASARRLLLVRCGEQPRRRQQMERLRDFLAPQVGQYEIILVGPSARHECARLGLAEESAVVWASNFGALLAEASKIVCRAGASTLAEAVYTGTPAVIERLAGPQERGNAEWASRAGDVR